MENLKRGSHTAWHCGYDPVWTTRYGYAVLGGDVGQRWRKLLREVFRSRAMSICAGLIDRDHVPMRIGIPPHISLSRAVQ
jgi:putative transposase